MYVCKWCKNGRQNERCRSDVLIFSLADKARYEFHLVSKWFSTHNLYDNHSVTGFNKINTVLAEIKSH